MAQRSIKLNALAALSEGEREQILAKLIHGARLPRNGQASALDARIRDYEIRFEMTSEELHQELRAGRLRETAEIAHWLFLLGAREDTGVVTA